MRKLPVFATIAHVWRTAVPNLGTAFLVSWPWLLVLVPVSYYGNSLAEPADLIAGRYFPELAATLLVALATLFAFSSIAIAWHRFLLKGEMAQGWSRLRVDAVVWIYFRDTLLIIAAVAVIVLPGVTLPGAALTTARSAVRRDVVAWVVELLVSCTSGSAAVTLASLNAVPDTPDAIDSARIA